MATKRPRTAKHRRLGGQMNGPAGTLGAPTIEQRRQNRLKLATQEAAENKITAYENLNKIYPILVDSLISIAKGKSTRLDKDTGEQVPVGDYKVLKQLLDLHADMYLDAAKILDWIDKNKASGHAPEDIPAGVAIFSTKAS